MTSRERVLTSIKHKEPDRVPIDLGSTPSSGISAIAYSRLKNYLGITSGNTRIYDVVQQLAQPEDEFLDKFHVDVIDIGRSFNSADEDWYDIELWDNRKAQYPVWFKPKIDIAGNCTAFNQKGIEIAIMLPGMPFFDQTCFPFIDGYPNDYKNLSEAMDNVHWSALAHSPWDSASKSDFWGILRQNAIRLRNSTDKALMIVCGCNLFEWGTFLRKIDNFLMDLISDQSNVEKLLDALLELHLNTLNKVCDSVGDIVDIIRFGDDLGMDSGPFMSPKIYKQLFKPRHRILCEYVKKNSNMHTFLHSCGSIYALLPDLIEAGFEIINPVQTSCYQMEPERLKKEFGKDITFWGGGCETRTILNNAKPEIVKSHVKKRLDIFSPDGGFIFNTIHNILSDVPPENIIAMYEAIEEYYQ
jgi:uroporphyrinogen decarboxylase